MTFCSTSDSERRRRRPSVSEACLTLRWVVRGEGHYAYILIEKENEKEEAKLWEEGGEGGRRRP